MSLPDLGAFTAQIYLAALSHDQWPKVLDAIGGALRGASAILAVHPLCGGLRWAMTSHIDPASLVAYEAKFSTPRTNPYLLLCDRLPVGEPLAAETIAGAEQFQDTDFYLDILRPQNLRHSVVLTLFKDQHSVAGVAFLRPASAGPFTPSELDLLRGLAPHLQRVVHLTLRTEQLALRSNALAEALSVSATGVLIVDDAARVAFMNPAAARLAAAADGLSIADGHLTAADRGIRARMMELFATATRLPPGELGARALAVTRPSGRRAYSLIVWPLQIAAGLFALDAPAALVLVADPEAEPHLPSDLLTAVYGLTPAEATVAGMLAGGRDLQEVADDLGVSRHTVKSHVRQIFSKTGTRRQAQLVRLLLQLPSVRLR